MIKERFKKMRCIYHFILGVYPNDIRNAKFNPSCIIQLRFPLLKGGWGILNTGGSSEFPAD
jgi:hypothetical protein